MPLAYGSSAGMNKGVEEIIVLPSISRALVLCGTCTNTSSLSSQPSISLDHTVHFYVLPALDPVPQQSIRPIRGVLALAVDELYLRPGTSLYEHEPVEFSVVKKSTIMQYGLKERLVMQRVCVVHGCVRQFNYLRSLGIQQPRDAHRSPCRQSYSGCRPRKL